MSKRQSDILRAGATTAAPATTGKKIDKETLLKALEKEDNSGKLLKIDISYIQPTSNIRSEIIDNANFTALKESIKDYGIIHPIVVSKVGKKVSVVSGHRRLEAASAVGLKEVPVILKIYKDDRDRTVEQVIENVVREDLSPIDFANAIHEIKQNERVSATKIAALIGQKDRKYVERLCKIALWDDKAKLLAKQKHLSLFQLMNIAKRGEAQGQKLIELLQGSASTERQGATVFDQKVERKMERWFKSSEMKKSEQNKFKSIGKMYQGIPTESRELLQEFLVSVWS